MKWLFLFCILFGSVNAALPPLWQNVAELKAIFNDDKLGSHLESGDAIMDIKKTENGWLIVTNHRAVPVIVKYKEATMPGPAQFDIEFGKAQVRSLSEE